MNEYLDAELPPAAHDAVHAHVVSCATCATVVADLVDIKRRAAALGVIAPPPRLERRLHGAIASGLPTTPVWRSIATFGPLSAAAMLLIAALVGVRFTPLRQTLPSGTAHGVATLSDREQAQEEEIEAELQQSQTPYQDAIAGLQQLANSQHDALDPATAATLWESIALIDNAIGESRAALTLDPRSRPAQEGLLNGLKTKMALLEETLALINAARESSEG